LILGFLAYRGARPSPQLAKSEQSRSGAANATRFGGDPKQNPSLEAFDIVPFSPELREITDQLIARRQNEAARFLLQRYLTEHPDDPHATFLLGLTFHREQKYGQAVTYFDKAIELAPSYHLPSYFAGWALYNLGDLDRARTAFQSFLDFKPDHPDSLFGIGLIELDADELDAARSHFQRSIDLLTAQTKPADPQDIAKARTRLAEVYERQDQLEKAKSELVQATTIYPDNYEGLYKLYRVLVRLNEKDEPSAFVRCMWRPRNGCARERVFQNESILDFGFWVVDQRQAPACNGGAGFVWRAELQQGSTHIKHHFAG
jgi:tetratricopeptide (TPR) repeat protein